MAILSAWTWLHFTLRDDGLSCRVVIQRNDMEYLLPIDGDFSATCEGLSVANLGKLRQTLRRYGKARVKLRARLRLNGETVARFSGDYVAVLLD